MMERKPGRLLVNLFAALFTILWAASNFIQFAKGGGKWGASHLLLGIQMFLAAVFFIARSAPTAVSWKPVDVLTSFVGTFAPSLFSLENGKAAHPLGLLLQLLGTGLAAACMLSLGRSIGILPANRGVRTKGVYSLVRHPLYASYQIANAGYLINHPGAYNFIVAALCLLSQVARIFAEERLLGSDPAYREYRKQVVWKMIPFVF